MGDNISSSTGEVRWGNIKKLPSSLWGEGGVRGYANRYLGSPGIFACKAKTYEQITPILCERNDAEGSVDNSVFFFSVHFSFCITIKKKSEQSNGTFLLRSIKKLIHYV